MSDFTIVFTVDNSSVSFPYSEKTLNMLMAAVPVDRILLSYNGKIVYKESSNSYTAIEIVKPSAIRPEDVYTSSTTDSDYIAKAA